MAVFQRFHFRHTVVFTFSNSASLYASAACKFPPVAGTPHVCGEWDKTGLASTRSVGRRGIRSDCCLMPQVQGPTASVFAYGFSS